MWFQIDDYVSHFEAAGKFQHNHLDNGLVKYRFLMSLVFQRCLIKSTSSQRISVDSGISCDTRDQESSMIRTNDPLVLSALLSSTVFGGDRDSDGELGLAALIFDVDWPLEQVP